jgi:hypothetical protein
MGMGFVHTGLPSEFYTPQPALFPGDMAMSSTLLSFSARAANTKGYDTRGSVLCTPHTSVPAFLGGS